MKKTLYQIGMLAAAAIAFVGCQKEVDINNQEEFTHVATIILNKADDTKTAVDETGQKASYYWTAGDDQYLHVYENGTAGTITNFDISDPTVAILTVSFTGTPTAPYSYEARYYSEASNSGNPKVPAEQSPKSDNFDPAADIMISKVITSNDRLTSLEFIMGRVVTVNKMTLTGLTAGEKVSKVEFTLDKQISAIYQLSSNTFTSNSTKLTLNYSNAEVPTGGSFPVYFVAAPVENAAIKSVVVTTDTNVYTKSDQLDPNPFANKSITFAVGTMKRFNMAMGGYGTAIPNAVKYYEVTSADEIADGGIYLITSTKTNGDAYAFGAYNSSFYSAEAVTISNDPSLGNYIEISAEQVLPVTLEDAGNSQFYILDADGKYLSYSGSSNDVSRGDTADGTAYKWTVAVHEIASVNVNGRKLQFNNNSPRFACYSTSQRPITLYYQEGSIVVTQKLPAPTNVDAIVVDDDILVTWEDITAPSGETVTYHVTCTGEAAQDIAEGVESATFENLADGTYEISVTAVPSTSAYSESNTVTYGNLVVNTTPAPTNAWVLVSAVADVTEGDYVITWDNDLYLPSDATFSSNPTVGTGITVSNNLLTNTVTSDMVWNFAGDNTDGFAVTAGSYRLNSTNAAHGISITTTGATTWTVSINATYGMLMKGSDAGTRYLAVYNNASWRYYALGTSYSGTLRLYKHVINDGKSDAEISLSGSGATFGDSPIQLTLSNPHNIQGITFASSNTNVATVTNEGIATIVGGGNTTITASWEEQTIGTTTYRAGSATYNLFVAQADVTVAFSNPTVKVAVGATVQNVATVTPTGLEITYTSSNTSIATVNSAGVVTGQANGIATITATYPGNESYKGAADSYTITVGEVNDGTLAHPYTATDVLGMTQATGVYVRGKISEITEVNTSYGNATYNITDGTNTIIVYRGKYLNNASFTSASQIAVNDEVVVYGDISQYQSVSQVSQGNYLYSINGITKALTAGTLSTSVDNANKQITVTWGAATGTDSSVSYVVNCGTQSYNASAAGSHAFTMSDYGTYTVSVEVSASDAISATASTTATLTDPTAGTKTYTLTINANDFNTTSYAANNNEKTSNAVAGDNTTCEVKWTSNQVMKNGTNMQWQKNNGYIYNSTDLGTIKSVTVNSSAGSFTTYYGTTEHPTSGTTVGNGYFTVKVGNATGTTSNVVIVFEK